MIRRTLFWLILVGACLAQPEARAGQAPADSCAIWREQATVYRQAYRLRLMDLERARLDSTLAVIAARSEADSLRASLRWSQWQLQAVKDDVPRWYETHDAGVAKGLLVAFLAVWAAGALD